MITSDHPLAFHIMAKPSGSACNLSCDYCFFLKKERLYPGSNFRMSDEVHEAYIKQLFEAHQVPQVTVAWQGGEPTLMGLDFFRRSIELQKKYQRPGLKVENTFQTNGILLDDDWCRFFCQNNFLIGLSLDGPKELHDYYRKDKGGQGTFDRVMRAVRLLKEHEVEFNILCSVNSRNADYPLEVYRFFRDELDVHFLQFIPIVERNQATMEIRKRWPENGPKIIAVTAYALHGDKEKCLAVGMDGYIPKPVLKEDLAKVLGKYSIGA